MMLYSLDFCLTNNDLFYFLDKTYMNENFTINMEILPFMFSGIDKIKKKNTQEI